MVTWNDLIKFLRSISRTRLKGREREYISLFCKREVPWDNLLMMAEMEGVSGLLYFNLKNSGILSSLPDSFSGPLENICGRIREQTTSIMDEAEALSKRFKQAGIPVVALQGLSLMTIYGDPVLRPLGDVDLMVKPIHKFRLKELLYNAGYQDPLNTHPNLFLKDNVCLDVHTHVLNLDRIHSRKYLFPVDLSSMWDRAEPLFDQSGGLLTLDPFDNHIALTVHALKHGYSRLIWLVDLHESLLKLRGMDNGLEKIMERARFWHQENTVLYSLVLLEGIFNIQLPFRFKRELGITRLNILERYLLSKKIHGFTPRELFYLLWLFNIKGIKNKIRFIKESVLPRDEIMAQIFHDYSTHAKGSIYVKRIGEVMIKMSKIFNSG